jgi:hypothetical protein
MRRNSRNPFTQQGALPGGSTTQTPPPTTAANPATSTYAPPTYPSSTTPDLDVDIDDSYYRPTRPSEGS